MSNITVNVSISAPEITAALNRIADALASVLPAPAAARLEPTAPAASTVAVVAEEKAEQPAAAQAPAPVEPEPAAEPAAPAPAPSPAVATVAVVAEEKAEQPAAREPIPSSVEEFARVCLMLLRAHGMKHNLTTGEMLKAFTPKLGFSTFRTEPNCGFAEALTRLKACILEDDKARSKEA